MEPIAKVSEFSSATRTGTEVEAPCGRRRSQADRQRRRRTARTEGAPGAAAVRLRPRRALYRKQPPVPEPAATWNDPTKIDGGTVTPSLQAGAETCNMGIGLPMYENDPFNSKATGATSGLSGGSLRTITVTDIHASGGAPWIYS